MKVRNLTGKPQPIHYTDKTIIVENGEVHNLRLPKLQRPELSRLENIFEFQEDDKAQNQTGRTASQNIPAHKPKDTTGGN